MATALPTARKDRDVPPDKLLFEVGRLIEGAHVPSISAPMSFVGFPAWFILLMALLPFAGFGVLPHRTALLWRAVAPLLAVCMLRIFPHRYTLTPDGAGGSQLQVWALGGSR